MTRKERFEKFIDYFSVNQPEVQTELHYENPFQLLVAVILSAQCTDKRINLTTPSLFKKYPSPKELSQATLDEVFELIRSISYPNNKAKHLLGMANMLLYDFKGEIPSEVNELVKLPGVGRKTANVIASVIFNQPAMAVDTHVFRVSARLGLTLKANTPQQAETQLMKYIPTEYVARAHHWLILHGRYVCLARSPKCVECALNNFCKSYKPSNNLF